nr:hypothetical protein [Kibdelosporangium sp. MJ126-NF4]CTQ91213.1 hypothetical protein [Kibdelosporangium sp. MJ126-NF4]
MNTSYEGAVVAGFDGSESSQRAVNWARVSARDEAGIGELDGSGGGGAK